MKKKIFKRSLALGALMAFAITGNAIAAGTTLAAGKTLYDNKFESQQRKTYQYPLDLSWMGGYYYNGVTLIFYDNQNTINEVTEEVTYSLTIDSATKDFCYSKVLGQGYKTGGTDLTFTNNVTIEGETNSARNFEGQAAIIGVDIYKGILTFEGDLTKIDVKSTGDKYDSAISAVGVQAWGYEPKNAGYYNSAEIVFAGKNVEIDVTGNDSNEGTKDMAGKPGIVDGIVVNEDAKVTVNSNTNLKIATHSNGTGQTSAINVSGGMFESNGNVNINSSSDSGEAYGIKASNEGWTATSDTFKGNTNLSFNGTMNMEVTGDSRAFGVYVDKTSADESLAVSFNDDITDITVKSDNIAQGVVSVKGADVSLNSEQTNIKVSDKSGKAAGDALVAMSQGKLKIDSNIYVSAANAITAGGEAQVSVNADNNNKITQLNGNINFDYDGKINNIDVNVNLSGEDSYWDGNSQISWAASISADAVKVTGLNVALNDGAQWNPSKITENGTAGSAGSKYLALNNLNLNEGIVNIDVAKTQDQAVQVENLTGTGGTVNFTVDKTGGALTTGTFKVFGGAEATQVAANYIGITADDVGTKEKFKALVKESLKIGESSASTFTAYVEEGLITPAMTGVTTNDINGNGLSIQNIQQASSTTTMDAMRNIASTAIIAWRQEDSTLSQRLGELRNSEGDQGVWVRMSRGEFEYNGAYKNQYNYFQMGYDKAYGAWHYGAAVSHNDGQTAYANGKGDNRSTSLSLYGTWLGASGQYADIVLKQGRLSNEFEIHTAAGDTRGDYDAWGTSLSGEYGVKMDMSDGWYVTPQAQLTFMRIGGEDYTTSNNIRVSQDTLYSTVGRVGFELGKNITDKGSVYAKASLLHEFAGDADTYLRLGDLHNSYSQDIGNTWYEAGLGFNYKTGADSYVYADVVKTFGDDIKTPWQWNVGMRWSF